MPIITVELSTTAIQRLRLLCEAANKSKNELFEEILKEPTCSKNVNLSEIARRSTSFADFNQRVQQLTE